MLLPSARSFLAGSGALPVWPAVIAVWGPGEASDWHAHHAWHLVLAIEGTLRVQAGREQPFSEAAAVLTRPDAPHALDARGGAVFLIFVSPESEFGARLASTARAPVHLFEAAEAARLRATFNSAGPGADPVHTARLLLDELGLGAARPALRHPAVHKVLRYLEQAEADASQSLEHLAELAGLSPSRLMHAFTQHVGTPLRPYLKWLRLQRAAAAIARGSSFAAAAHAAGFADAAHMTRSFRAMFGTTPSALRDSSSKAPGSAGGDGA